MTLASLPENIATPKRATRLRITVLDEEIPFPMNSGKRIRTLNLLRRLARDFDITFVCHRNPDTEEASQGTEFLQDHGIRLELLDYQVPQKSGLGFYGRLAGNLLSRLPYSVQIHRSRQIMAKVHELTETGRTDLIHVEWTPYAASLLGTSSSVPWVVMAHNIESLIWQRYHEAEKWGPKQWYIGHQWRKYVAFEKRVFGGTSRLITVSGPDADLARREFGAGRVDVVDNGVDLDYFCPTDTVRDPTRLLFLGSLDWRPNQDAVIALLDTLLPSVRVIRPDICLDIVGRNPPDWLQAKALGLQGVEVHANVPDVRPYLWRAGMLVVPLRIGGGSRLKILEALATECPVVSTRVGAEGLELQPDRDFVEVADIPAMAEAIVDACADADLTQARATAGRAQVIGRYGWPQLSDRLGAIWTDVAVGQRTESFS